MEKLSDFLGFDRLQKITFKSLLTIGCILVTLMLAAFSVGEYAFIRCSFWNPDADGWYGVINGEENMASE